MKPCFIKFCFTGVYRPPIRTVSRPEEMRSTESQPPAPRIITLDRSNRDGHAQQSGSGQGGASGGGGYSDRDGRDRRGGGGFGPRNDAPMTRNIGQAPPAEVPSSSWRRPAT
jgi:hypothetical protein